jgi:hypothetical protein
MNAESGNNDFYPVNLPWDVHPDHDQTWFEKETRNMSPRQIAQELECSFNSSGETVIDPEEIAKMLEGAKDPIFKTGFDRNFWLWEKYDSNFTYLLVADVARGDGSDFSVFQLMKVETQEIIGEYQGKPTLSEFATLLDTTGREFGNCLLVVENNSLGISVLEKLQELNYPNLYYSVKGTHEFVDAIEGQNTTNTIPGFTTSQKTRPLIVAKLEEFIRNRLIKVYSTRLINEFKTFIWANNRAEAMRSYHDDLIMSLAISCWVKDTALTVNQRELEYKRSMLGSMMVSRGNIQSTIPGMQGHKVKGFSEETLKRKQEYDNFIWLIKG